MSGKLRLYVDVCCSKRLPAQLHSRLAGVLSGLEIKHLLSEYPTNAEDPEWLEPLRGQNWIVITGDRGRDLKKPRLPMLCEAWGITHICFTPKLLKAGPFVQENALVAVWPGILGLLDLPPGTGARLGEYGVTAGGVIRYSLKVAGEHHYVSPME